MERKLWEVLSLETKLGEGAKRFLKVSCHRAGSGSANNTIEQDCITLSLLMDAKEMILWQ